MKGIIFLYYIIHIFILVIIKFKISNSYPILPKYEMEKTYNEYPIIMCETVCKKLEECRSNSWLVCSWTKFGQIPDTVCCNIRDFTFQWQRITHIRPYCGFSTHYHRIFKRIISGVNGEFAEFPWMATIFRFNQFICGAVIISNNFLLTSAHCFLPLFDESVYTVKIGSNNMDECEELFVSHIIIHDSFLPPEVYNDIALVKMKSRINIGDKMSPVCLPNKEMKPNNLVGIKTTVIGFGATIHGGHYSKILQKIYVSVATKEECEKSYRDFDKLKLPLGFQNSIMCAGYAESNEDTCYADSGGPMTVVFNDIHFLVGIISYGHKCGKKGFPTLYTNVAYHRNWILSSIVNNS